MVRNKGNKGWIIVWIVVFDMFIFMNRMELMGGVYRLI